MTNHCFTQRLRIRSVAAERSVAGDEYHGILKARFLASWASWRGDYQTKEVDKVLHDFQKDARIYTETEIHRKGYTHIVYILYLCRYIPGVET